MDIVVGVDGSESARAALRFAVEEARLRSARVRVVAAWDVPTDPTSLSEELDTSTRRTVDLALGELGDVAGDIVVETVVREGQAPRS